MRWFARIYAIGRVAGRRAFAALLIGVVTVAALAIAVRSESDGPSRAASRAGGARNPEAAVSAAARPLPAAPTARAGRAARTAVDPAGEASCDPSTVDRFRAGDTTESTMERIRESPRRFCWSLRPVLAESDDLLRLVDRDHGLEPGYEPTDLVSLAEAHPEIPLRTGNERLTARAAEALADMVLAAERDGIELMVSSAYRDYETQRQLHEYWIERLGRTMAEALSAPAGHSQHQLGTTVDFAPVGRRFGETPQAEWLEQHAWRYGFSLSYPEGYETMTGYNYEPWHYRYVGFAAAYLEREFFSSVQHKMLTFLHENSRDRRSVAFRFHRGGPR